MAEVGAYTMKMRISFSLRFTFRMIVSRPMVAACFFPNRNATDTRLQSPAGLENATISKPIRCIVIPSKTDPLHDLPGNRSNPKRRCSTEHDAGEWRDSQVGHNWQTALPCLPFPSIPRTFIMLLCSGSSG